jgi:hypothetical protein
MSIRFVLLMFLLLMSIGYHHGYRQARGAGIYYVPKWTEFAATLMAFTAVVMAFRYVLIDLDTLPKNGPKPWMAGEGMA